MTSQGGEAIAIGYITGVPQRSTRKAATVIPTDVDNATVEVKERRVALTNLRKVYFPKLGLTKGDLLCYYVSISDALLPHVSDRPMVMKRYPHGVTGDFVTSSVRRRRGRNGSRCVHDRASFRERHRLSSRRRSRIAAMARESRMHRPQSVDSLCDDPDRPLYIHFDLDPTPNTPFAVVREAALIVGEVCVGSA